MKKREASANEKEWVFWLAIVLSVIGIIAVVVLALHAVGLI